MSEEDLIEVMMGAAVASTDAIAEDFDDPTDDWMPTLLVLDEESHSLNVVMLPGECFDGERGRAMLGQVMMPALATSMHANGLCLITSAWAVEVDVVGDNAIEEGMEAVSNETHEGRKEIISVVAVTAEESAMQYAEIIRSRESPPRLEWGECARTPNDEEGVVEGYFPDAMRSALKRVMREQT